MDKNQIRKVLERHEGRTNAITRRELRELLAIPENQDRKMRELVGELRREGLPVLFATSEPAGYYLPASLNELEEGRRQLRSYIIDECVVLARWKTYGHRFLAKEEQGVLI